MSSCVQGGRAGEDGQAGTGRRTSLRSGACRTQQRAMHDRETGLAGRIAAACDMDPLGGLAGAEALIAPYRAARPRATPARLYAAIASDRRFGFGRRGRRRSSPTGCSGRARCEAGGWGRRTTSTCRRLAESLVRFCPVRRSQPRRIAGLAEI